MTTKYRLHQMVDALPDNELDEAERLLAALMTDDPVLRAVRLAPLDDEAETDDERAAVQEGLAERDRGELVDDADVA
jgi:predicted transcriptional regulator